MRFELYSNSTNEKNVIYVKIIDDNGKYIGNTLIRSFTYKDYANLKEKMQHEHEYTRIACMEAAKHVPSPGVIAYVGIIEIDHRERGRGYGPQVLRFVPQICKQFNLPMPTVICAYIKPHQYKLDLETYQHQSMTPQEHRIMKNTMFKTFNRAGYKKTNILKPRVVVKRVV